MSPGVSCALKGFLTVGEDVVDSGLLNCYQTEGTPRFDLLLRLSGVVTSRKRYLSSRMLYTTLFQTLFSSSSSTSSRALDWSDNSLTLLVLTSPWRTSCTGHLVFNLWCLLLRLSLFQAAPMIRRETFDHEQVSLSGNRKDFLNHRVFGMVIDARIVILALVLSSDSTSMLVRLGWWRGWGCKGSWQV